MYLARKCCFCSLLDDGFECFMSFDIKFMNRAGGGGRVDIHITLKKKPAVELIRGKGCRACRLGWLQVLCVALLEGCIKMQISRCLLGADSKTPTRQEASCRKRGSRVHSGTQGTF